MGEYLIVGVSSDEFNSVKGKKTYYPFEERKLLVESVKYVDLVIPETDWQQKEADIIKFDVKIIVMGDDWLGKFDYLKDLCEVVYMERTANISTTKIKNELSSM